MYQFYGVSNDMQVITLPRDTQFAVDMDAIEALCASDPKPRILFLASPNNPDGGVLTDAQLERLLTLPLLVVLDEAYVEFSGGSRVAWVAERENLIVLRTFSKWAGLAGLRVGYGVYPDALMNSLWRLKSPYNVNGVAQAAALATLEGIDEALGTVDEIVQERESLIARLREIPYLRVFESQANYVLCGVRGISVEVIRAAMEQRGIILRYFGNERLADHIRISVGTPMQDAAVLMVLQNLTS
jgi:histidinol-phosphate aminotransferase